MVGVFVFELSVVGLIGGVRCYFVGSPPGIGAPPKAHIIRDFIIALPEVPALQPVELAWPPGKQEKQEKQESQELHENEENPVVSLAGAISQGSPFASISARDDQVAPQAPA